ncbi:hypothetical protein [Streptococcus suis]|uniref:hypothetical protein n=1 Tax=Streptococcus suis TaxID=1307 RepID=UPI001960EC77|nr:hypothetical protein [Streptococcus suis]MBM7285198.1 hypothetical protein [Streptococcus suis]MCO8238380.1 hypothetical protein [Streptococcus suis]HEM3534075.1 hypothetical protein [Streptococcus suis]
MRKEPTMEAQVTKNGYKYYIHKPRKPIPVTPQVVPSEAKWKKGLTWLGGALLAGLKNLPYLIMRTAILLVTTPLMILLFIFNLIKSLIMTAIGWFVFKVVVGFTILSYHAFFTKDHTVIDNVETWFRNWTIPTSGPIFQGWETTIIVVLAIITALSLTIYSRDDL